MNLRWFSSTPSILGPSHSPTSLYNDCKGSEADSLHKGSQTLAVPGRLANPSPISGGSENSDRDRPDTVIRVDNQSREVQTQTHSGFFRSWARNTT